MSVAAIYYATLPFSLVLFFSSLENQVIYHSPMKGQQENPASFKTFYSNQLFHGIGILHSSWNFPAKKCRFPSGYTRTSRHKSKDCLCFFILHFSQKIFVLFDSSFLFFYQLAKTFVYCTTESIIGSN